MSDFVVSVNYKSWTREPHMGTSSQCCAQLPRCLVCGGQTAKRFSKAFRGSNISYFMCLTCHHLTAGETSENPVYGGGRYFEEVDTGWEGRNRRLLHFVRFITRLPGIRLFAGSAMLDFGCGIGRLVEDLNRAGFNAFGFEPFPESSVLPDRVFADWSQARRTIGQLSLVTCIEVLEHLRDPDKILDDISSVLISAGYLLISTEVYKRGTHKEDWYYLNPAAGHVSIFSERSLRALLRRHDFEAIFRINPSLWLYRRVASVPRSLVELGYFAVSQSRVKLGVRVNYRKRGENSSDDQSRLKLKA